ncbi:MAG: hypothetical protein A2V69_03305 [Candidatus Portnoybacteria bacterium RBG_13_40_8]|uniref:Uncharacterized protein n=1 Tax=Candidatus Portnoybacteria bacterium RBG_13_40_8 TaxID=1801990 RepID=A0A1G2F421_9BACT|nr:MAG: hypothetical protein A2V69_03305 [Candidatus Portnoybacteria bacterium RBG_13_40_8]OGZ34991.1 MAG: hypothetical protein A2V60_00390 [Candidatus Portnoybacteria bacterium RIFCSPHIGHO2_01_FULL_39_19]
MLITISQIVFAISIIGILVIVLRKVPVILRYPRHPFEETSLLERVKTKINSSNFFHEIFIHRTEKILRRIKIIVLKFDNFLARIVDRLRDRLKRRKEEEQENNDFNSPS